MDELLVLLDELTEDIYNDITSLINSGMRIGCDCGCGGDSFDMDQYQELVDESESIHRRVDIFMELSGTSSEEFEELTEYMTSVSYRPRETDEWYQDPRSDFDQDIADYGQDVLEYYPLVMFYMIRLMKEKPNIVEEYNERLNESV